MSTADLNSGLKSKRYLRGTLRCKRDDWTDCYVIVHSENKKQARRAVMVTGADRVNRALDGDVVALEIVSAPSLAPPTRVSLQKKARSEAGAVEECAEPSVDAIEGIAAEPGGSSGSSQQEFGAVVGILRRSWRQYAGVLDVDSAPAKDSSKVSRGLDGDDGDASRIISFIPVRNHLLSSSFNPNFFA